MERLIERLMMCGLTRMQAKGVSKGFRNLKDFEQYVESVEAEYRNHGKTARR